MTGILCAGFTKVPFAPFDDAVDATVPGLQLYVDKLAPKKRDEWVAGAVWGQPQGAAEDAPLIAGGAIAWKGADGQRQQETWDGSPLTEDPRDAGQKESWGSRRPKWVGEGCFIGGSLFAKEQGVSVGDPTVNATVIIDLPPGMVLVPGAIAGLSRYDLSNGKPPYLTPQPPSSAGVTNAHAFGYNYIGACDEIWLIDNSPSDPIDDPAPYGERYSSGQIVFDVFHEGQTIAQVQANNARPKADPLTRPPQVGDALAIAAPTHGYFYQPAVGAFTDGDIGASGWPAGTWEFWIYTIPTSGEPTVEAITANPTQNYGIRIEGSETGSFSKSGNIHQLLWHYGQYVLLTGTWTQSRTTEFTGDASRPPNTTGPAYSDSDSPGGAGFPGGWPSAADAAGSEAGFWRSKEITKPGFGYFWPITKQVTLTWENFGIQVTVPHYTSEYISQDSSLETVSFDSRQGTLPRYRVVDAGTTSAVTHLADSNSSSLPFKRLGYEGRGPGITSYTLIGSDESCWVDAPDPLGPNARCHWVAGPSDGTCQVYVQWCFRPSEVRQYTAKTVVSAGTPISPPPNPNDFSDAPGSGVPGGGPAPPDFGFPPGIFPGGNWNESVTQATELEIMAAVSPSLRSRHYFREAFIESTNNQADWNGARSNSSLTPGSPTGSYELAFEIPYPMVSRSPQNSANTAPEEAVYLVRILTPRTRSSSFTPPYPYDSEVVYYQKAGAAPIAIAIEIFDLLPAIAWQDPEQYQWSRFLTLANGVLYVVPQTSEGLDYRAKNGKIQPQAFQVDDGSLSPLVSPSLAILKGDDADATVFDASFSAG